MIQYFSYLYNIKFDNIKKYKNYYFFSCNTFAYILSEIKGNVNFYINVISFLNNNNLFTYQIIKNIYNENIINYDNKSYCLIYIGSRYNSIVELDELLDFNKRSRVTILYKLPDWRNLWLRKISFLNQKLNNNKKIFENIKTNYYFYYGLCDSLLLYLYQLEKSYDKQANNGYMSISHRRIFNCNTKLNFYNPLNYIVDYYIRDIAEYFNSLYFNESNYLEDLEYYLKTEKLSKIDASLLFVRMVFPSSFFDYFETLEESYFNHKYCEIDEYINYIKKTYELINSYVSIQSISWLDF